MLIKTAYTNDSSTQFFFNEKAAQFHEKNTRQGRTAEMVYPIRVYGTKMDGLVIYSEIAGDIENGFIEVCGDLISFSSFNE